MLLTSAILDKSVAGLFLF